MAFTGAMRGLLLVLSVAVLLASGKGPVPVLGQTYPFNYPAVCYNTSGILSISPTWLGTTWLGWGTSLTWFANLIGGFSPERRLLFTNLLFNSSKPLGESLGLNMVRYNIGPGGYAPPNFTYHYTYVVPWRLMPGFQDGEDGPYDWNADARQRTVLLDAIQMGATWVEAISQSPPSWMTVSGTWAGSVNFGVDNLAPVNFTEFAKYIADVVAYTSNTYGVKFDAVSPTNEPLEGYWTISSGYHQGCNLKTKGISGLLPILAQEMQARGISAKTSTTDAWYHTFNKFNNINSTAFSTLDYFHVHGYTTNQSYTIDDYASQMQAMASVANNYSKGVIESEWGPQLSDATLYDTMVNMALQMTMQVNYMNVSGWYYWQALENGRPGFNWGLLQMNFTTAYNGGTYDGELDYQILPAYYAMLQFSRFFVAGTWPLQVDYSCGHGILAGYHPYRQQIVIIGTNTADTPVKLTAVFLGFFTGLSDVLSPVTIYRTSYTENFTSVGSFRTLIPGVFPITLNNKSVTTYVFENVAFGSGPPYLLSHLASLIYRVFNVKPPRLTVKQLLHLLNGLDDR